MRGRDDKGSFPLGSRGCSIGLNGDKQERAQRGSVLETKVRMPTMEDMITGVYCLCWDSVDDKNDS